MSTIGDLPDVILEFILHNVSPYLDIQNCSLVCHRWRRCCQRTLRKRQELFRCALASGPLCFTPLSPSGSNESPSACFSTPRLSHSACIVGSSMFVFGGCSLTHTTFNDLWRVDLSTRKKERVLAKSSGNYPTPKSHAVMVVWKGNLVLFGGWTSPCLYPLHQQGYFFDEVHMYNIEKNTWCQLLAGGPPPTAGHSATVHDDVLVVFGGKQKVRDATIVTSDIYCFNLIDGHWFQPRFSHVCPTPRYGQSQIKIDEKHILIVSGCSGCNAMHSDMWLLIIPKVIDSDEVWSWRQITLEGQEHMPKQLWCNPTCKIDNQIVVLARNKEPEFEVSMAMSQYLAPAKVKAQSSQVVPLNTTANSSIAIRAQSSLVRPAVLAATVVQPSHALQPDAAPGHSRPSVRPNASSNRELRLSMLSKYEDRLRDQSRSALPTSSSITTSKPLCRQAVYIMSLDRLLSHGVGTWVAGPPWQGSTAPHPRMVCSLLLGRDELVVCGGRTELECDCNVQDVLPPILYIGAPGLPPP